VLFTKGPQRIWPAPKKLRINVVPPGFHCNPGYFHRTVVFAVRNAGPGVFTGFDIVIRRCRYSIANPEIELSTFGACFWMCLHPDPIIPYCQKRSHIPDLHDCLALSFIEYRAFALSVQSVPSFPPKTEDYVWPLAMLFQVTWWESSRILKITPSRFFADLSIMPYKNWMFFLDKCAGSSEHIIFHDFTAYLFFPSLRVFDFCV